MKTLQSGSRLNLKLMCWTGWVFFGFAKAGSCSFCAVSAYKTAVSFDLASLPTGTMEVGSPPPHGDKYYISSPCANVYPPFGRCCSSSSAHTSGLQDLGSCYQLGLLEKNSTIELFTNSQDGFNLTLFGSGDPGTRSCGSTEPPLWGHRASKYNFICDTTVPITNPPEMVIEEVNCYYTIVWRHPSACGRAYGSSCSVPVPPTPPTPTPSTNNSCQPQWQPTWNMQRSTILYACNASGFHDVQKAIQFGVVVYDWSNAKAIWVDSHPMNDEELLTKQAEMVLAADPGIKGEYQRVWVYRNTIKALNWYTSVREKLDDPAYSGWFVRFKDYKGPVSNRSYHVPACTYEKCSGFYHDQEQSPEYPHGDGSCSEECDCGAAPCGEYIFDHRNASFADWFVNQYMISNETLFHDPIPIGLGWMDDSMTLNGPTEEDSHFIQDTGSSVQDMQEHVAAYHANMNRFHERVVQLGGFTWQLTRGHGSEVTSLNASEADECADRLRTEWCVESPEAWIEAYRYEVSVDQVQKDAESVTAEFLLTRGDYAWIGYGWLGCGANTDWPYPQEWTQDYGGKATGPCSETGNGTRVFRRAYPKAVVEWDCNTASGSIAA